MKAIILAGGLGSRLKPLTQIIPKPLLPVGEKSVLEITIQKMKEQGFDEVILAVNYKSHMFESYFGDGSRFGLEVSYSKEQKSLGTAGPILLAKPKLKDSFLVLNGDILTSMDFNDLRKFHDANQADLTLVTKQMQLPLHYGVVKKEANRVLHIEEKPVVVSEISAGIYFLNPGVIDYIPADKTFHMTDLMRKLIDDNKKVLAYPIEDYWLDIGQMSDYKKAQEDFENGLI
jgi:NDP-mannose synthase